MTIYAIVYTIVYIRKMERKPLHNRVAAFANELRRDPEVVGIWVRLDPIHPGTELVIHQKADESAELTIFKPNGKTESLQGRIIHRRLQRGHPIRQEIFVDFQGKKEVVLARREF